MSTFTFKLEVYIHFFVIWYILTNTCNSVYVMHILIHCSIKFLGKLILFLAVKSRSVDTQNIRQFGTFKFLGLFNS